jgi:hypothetical protein
VGLFSLWLALTVLLVSCSKSELLIEDTSSLDLEANLGFFRYNYTTQPLLYANLSLLMASETSADFSSFRFFGMLVPADGTSGSIAYVLDITDEKGGTVCRKADGVLSAGQVEFMVECVGRADINQLRTSLTATYKGASDSFTAQFSRPDL